MMTRIAKLDDPEAPFVFRRGTRVAWKRRDGTPDHKFIGEIVDGVCEFEVGDGWYNAVYVVKREDGTLFAAGETDLIPVA